MISRRDLLRNAGLSAVATFVPSLSFAKAETDARLVLVILRGAVDGLALVAPYGEGQYRSLRGELAIASPGDAKGLKKLDGTFGLHPSMVNTHKLFSEDQALVLHAVASPYRERSHFDGQDVLENGALVAGGLRDGWLNRAIAPLGGGVGNESAIAMSQNTPLVLRGANSVTSWAPSQLPDASDDTLRRIAALYENDEFFSTRLAQALDAQRIAGEMTGMENKRRGNQAAQVKALMRSTARFLTANNGPRIAVVEAGGWDTHANQGAASGSLANKFKGLDDALGELHKGMGATWSDTVVVVATEFGRTVKVNGTRGTDHGTATAALMLGGAIDGGRVIAKWPGLSSRDLYEGRDLYPTMDLRSVFKGILAQHLGISESHIETAVFPDSGSAPLLDGLIRS